MAQCIIMNKPVDFCFNEETAGDNEYMHRPECPDNCNKEALKEFEESVEACKKAGIKVIVFDKSKYPELENQKHPDGVFPNNWMSTEVNGEIMLYPVLKNSRKQEKHALPFYLKELVQENFQIQKLSIFNQKDNKRAALESTGSLIIDRKLKRVYAAISQRTDEAMVLKWAAERFYTPIIFETQSSHGKPIYHTNVMLSIGQNMAVVCAESIVEKDRERVLNCLQEGGRDVIEISYEQAEQHFCANILEVRSETSKRLKIIMSQSAFNGFNEEQKKILNQEADFVVFPLNVIEKVGGGSARCMICEVFLPQQDEFSILQSVQPTKIKQAVQKEIDHPPHTHHLIPNHTVKVH